MGCKVCKFGGSSLADVDQFRKVKAIISSDSTRRYIIPSAPGKRTPTDQKITDLLYLCHTHAQQDVPFDEVFEIISRRYLEIVQGLSISFDLKPHLEEIRQNILAGASADYTASRGEYLNGQIVSKLLDYEFVDAADIIHFDKKGIFDREKTKIAISERLKNIKRAVIPGFYGSLPDGSIHTFSRGGSDITGAIVAYGVSCDLYENWTDVSGLLMADPNIVENPKPIDIITYKEP